MRMRKDQIFKTDPYVVVDTRPGEINSNGSMAVFSCVDMETAYKIA